MASINVKRWSTVLAGALGCAAGAGVVSSYVFGMFVKAIAAEYDWGRSEATLSITCFYIASGIGSVVLGSILSRRPLRTVTAVFVALFAALIATVALLPSSIPLFCLIFALIGFFGAAATPMPYAIAIAGWFDRNRGLALAIAVSGTGISAIFMSTYANWLMERYGWRGGYVGVGLLVGVVALTGLLFFFRAPPVQQLPNDKAASFGDLYLRDRTFWLIAGPILMISIALTGMITSLAPMLTDQGLSMAQAAGLLGLIGGASWVSRLTVGLLLDRAHVRWIGAVIFTLIAIGVALIATGNETARIAGVILVGLGMGSEADLVTYCVSRYYGPRALARALGAVWVFWAWGAGIGVLIGSMAYDLTGTYDAALFMFVVLGITSAAVIARLGGYRFAQAKAPLPQPMPAAG